MFQDEDSDVGMSSDNSFSERKTFSPEKSEVMEEVLGFQNKDIEDSDDNEEISKESNFYDLPDTRAWGKKRKIYYVSDYVDTDLATLTEKDEENAALEEEEAKNIQKRLAKELDDVDFGLNVKTSGNEIELKSTINHIIKIDTSKFTNRQKLELLEKESPEFMVLLQDIKDLKVSKRYLISFDNEKDEEKFFNNFGDFGHVIHLYHALKDKLSEVKITLEPYLHLLKKKSDSNSTEFMFAKAKYQVLLNYCLNILFYLTLKAKRSSFNGHPVIKRLAQYRQLLNQLNSKKQLKNVSKQNKKDKSFEERNPIEEIQETILDNVSGNDVIDEENRRMITYQISKNKGLTPHRSKEQRNPRVKHRNKYRKAIIRRKGAVREARKEIYRYGGEVSGIKVGLKKSISLK